MLQGKRSVSLEMNVILVYQNTMTLSVCWKRHTLAANPSTNNQIQMHAQTHYSLPHTHTAHSPLIGHGHVRGGIPSQSEDSGPCVRGETNNALLWITWTTNPKLNCSSKLFVENQYKRLFKPSRGLELKLLRMFGQMCEYNFFLKEENAYWDSKDAIHILKLNFFHSFLLAG